MSTRATYSFINNQYRPDTTIYIHHDGYEEGGAYYLYNAFVAGQSLSAESMIRGNDKAEITDSHDAHGDTEYRYTVDGEKLTVEHRHTLIEFGSYPEGWRVVFSGDWVDFVNKHISQDWLDHDFQPLKRVSIDTYNNLGEVHTPNTLKALLQDELCLLGNWSINGHTESANGKALMKRIAAIKSHISEYGKPSWNQAA